MADCKCTEDTRIARNKDDIRELWKIMNELKNAINYRLPLWATFLIAALTSTTTGLIVRAFS